MRKACQCSYPTETSLDFWPNTKQLAAVPFPLLEQQQDWLVQIPGWWTNGKGGANGLCSPPRYTSNIAPCNHQEADCGACWRCCYAGLPQDPCLNCRTVLFVALHLVHSSQFGRQRSLALPIFHVYTGLILCPILSKLERRLHGKSGTHMMNSSQAAQCIWANSWRDRSFSGVLHHLPLWDESNEFFCQWSQKEPVHSQSTSDVRCSFNQSFHTAT